MNDGEEWRGSLCKWFVVIKEREREGLGIGCLSERGCDCECWEEESACLRESEVVCVVKSRMWK